MPDRWPRLCRWLAPDTLRVSAFDPAVADLERDWATGRRRRPGSTGRAVAYLSLALECRRLEAQGRLGQMSAHVARESWPMSFATDLRRAVRVLAHQPLFAAVAILTLALGIGANVAVFSYFDTFLLTRLPAPNADRVVRVYSMTPAGATDIIAYPMFTEIQKEVSGLAIAATASTTVLLTDSDVTENRQAELVTGDYFRIMGLTPLIGRLLGAQDDVAEGAHPVAVIAESLWRARFASDASIVGRTIRLNGHPFTIVGVVPAPYRGTLGSSIADLWAPVMMQQVLRPRGLTLATRGWGWLSMVGALAPGTGLDRANASLGLVAADLNRRFPAKVPLKLVAHPATLLPDRERQAIAPYLQLVAVFTGLILLAASANLAGVMQTRVIARRRETAIRQSLGASRWRLASEWLAECLVLSACAGLAGMIVARGVVSTLIRLKPPAEVIGNVSFDAPFDWRVLAFAAGAALLAGLLFGLGSAWRAARVQPGAVLKEEVGTMAGGGRGARWRRALVTIQVGVSTVLLLVAALLASGLVRAQTLTPGFETDHVALVTFRLPPSALAPGPQMFTPALLSAIRKVPGVAAADVTRSVPLEPGQDGEDFRIPGHVEPDGSATGINDAVVGAGYFEALGITFVRGQAWDPATEGRRDKVGSIVINETMAKQFWAGRDPVGSTIDFVSNGPVTVTGVVRDTAYYEVGEAPMPFVFIPAESLRPNGFTLVVRTAVDVNGMLPTLTRVANQIDPAIVAAGAFGFTSMRSAYLAPQRLLVTGAVVFGVLALLLTGVGLYGVVSAAVAQRTREIGVRMALGARKSQVLGAVFKDALALVVVGTALGLLAGYGLAGSLRAWIAGIDPLDPRLYGFVVALLALTAAAAAWTPARRAASIDPVTALRNG
jgi:predicted permease